MSEKQLTEREKIATVKAIEFKLGREAEILMNSESPNNDFLEALRDACILNQIRDHITK